MAEGLSRDAPKEQCGATQAANAQTPKSPAGRLTGLEFASWKRTTPRL